VRNRFSGGIRQIVDRKDEDVIAHPDPAIFTPVSLECRLTKIDSHFL
jgi:hypothetical protein